MGLDCVTGGFTIDTGTICITDLFAALGTGHTDLGANPANVVVEGGATQ
jgi:hypothetical protein